MFGRSRLTGEPPRELPKDDANKFGTMSVSASYRNKITGEIGSAPRASASGKTPSSQTAGSEIGRRVDIPGREAVAGSLRAETRPPTRRRASERAPAPPPLSADACHPDPAARPSKG